MGYTTDFMGCLELTPKLNEKQRDYINLISSTRRMKRDVNKLMELYKGEHGNPFAKNKKDPKEVYGHEGEFFAKDDGNFGQGDDGSVIDHNCPPGQKGFAQGEVEKGQPGLWCQWEISEDGTELFWDGGEKFYNYIAWLKYIIKNFFIPWGIFANGEIEWQGEERDDIGKIKVKNNEIFVYDGEITFPDEE
jgi:hypothetical protein